ncbi:hypothetical protein PAHAL_4G264500 [Panicum hallii]|uniref:Uncharacterized protein n=1 Tax=Panicum hallii TaxID=206008 RepID=A0A2S3HKA5_9POAL|nr:hypothetical protein PAHAL_4G264500 [Panicum hallii]
MDDHTVDMCAKSKRISFIALNSFLLQLLLPLECYQILCKNDLIFSVHSGQRNHPYFCSSRAESKVSPPTKVSIRKTYIAE